MGINNTNELPETPMTKKWYALCVQIRIQRGTRTIETRGQREIIFYQTCYDNTIGERNNIGVSISVDIYTGKR